MSTHTESYYVNWKTGTGPITLGVSPVHVPDAAVGSIVIKEDKQNNYPDRSGIEQPEDVVAKINLRSGTFALAGMQIHTGTIVSYTSTKTLNIEDLSGFSWV